MNKTVLLKYVDQLHKVIYEISIIDGVIYEDLFFANIGQGVIKKTRLKNKVNIAQADKETLIYDRSKVL